VRALRISDLNGPEALELSEVPEPEPTHMLSPGEGVIVEVKAAAVSFPDVLQSRGLYQFKPDLPFVPGAEVSGVVRAAP
jgi:NADPH:quinone reductase